MKKLIFIIICLLTLLTVGCNNKAKVRYDEATNLFNEGQYMSAKNVFEELKSFKESKLLIEECEKYHNFSDKLKKNEFISQREWESINLDYKIENSNITYAQYIKNYDNVEKKIDWIYNYRNAIFSSSSGNSYFGINASYIWKVKLSYGLVCKNLDKYYIEVSGTIEIPSIDPNSNWDSYYDSEKKVEVTIPVDEIINKDEYIIDNWNAQNKHGAYDRYIITIDNANKKVYAKCGKCDLVLNDKYLY